MSDSVREAFERWHDGLFDISAATIVKTEYGYPQNAVIQMRWQTWQAATAAADAEWRGVVEELALMVKRAKSLHENNSIGNQGYGLALDEALAQAEQLMGEKK